MAVDLASSNLLNPVSGPILLGGSSSWTYEQMPLSSMSGLTHSDDEISVIRNTNGDLYVATETQRPNEGSAAVRRADPQVIVFRRVQATGIWSQHVVKGDDQTSTTDRKRPVVAIVDNTLYVIAIAQGQTETSYRTAPLSTMDFGSTGWPFTSQWTPLINTQFERFRNNIVPREPTTAAAKLPVLVDWAWQSCTNCPSVTVQDTAIWQTSLPNTGNQAPGAFAGVDKTVAASPATNLGATVTDDALGTPVNWVWTQVGGPAGGVLFTDGTGACAGGTCPLPTTAVFPGGVGTYVLRLTATESGTTPLVNVDEVTITVNAAVESAAGTHLRQPGQWLDFHRRKRRQLRGNGHRSPGREHLLGDHLDFESRRDHRTRPIVQHYHPQ